MPEFEALAKKRGVSLNKLITLLLCREVSLQNSETVKLLDKLEENVKELRAKLKA